MHCLSGPQLDTYLSTNENLTGTSQIAPVVAEARLFARGCERESGTLLPWVGTRDAARDMEAPVGTLLPWWAHATPPATWMCCAPRSVTRS